MSANEEWRWTDERGVQRRVSAEELLEALAAGVLSGSTLVWRRGMPEWRAAHEVPELSRVILTASNYRVNRGVPESVFTEK